jgi:hypothetical protein
VVHITGGIQRWKKLVGTDSLGFLNLAKYSLNTGRPLRVRHAILLTELPDLRHQELKPNLYTVFTFLSCYFAILVDFEEAW